MCFGKTDLVFLLLFLQFLQSEANLFFNFVRLFKFILGLDTHIFEIIHHFNLLLKGSHLDLDFDGLFLELCVCQ